MARTDEILRQFMRDFHAKAEGAPPCEEPGASSLENSSSDSASSPNSKNFDSAQYAKERDAAAMARISLGMDRRRYGRTQKVESVANGSWNPHKDFLNNGRDPHRPWKSGR
jgi:hypothetical protein